MLLDLASGDWDEDLLALWSIPRAVLPRIVDSTGPHFAIRGLDGIHAPLAGVAGDQQAALFGLQCFSAGDAKCTYGTGCFILVNTGDTRPQPAAGLLVTPAWRTAGRTTWALEGSVFMGGALVQWLRDALGLIDSAEAIQALAESVPDSGGVTLVPAFTGLGAPHWDADARGLIIGLTRGTNKGHLARAALEGIALQVADVLAAIGEGLPTPPSSLRVDGGAARNDLLMGIQAAVLELELERPAILESTAIGAGALAGLGAGVWPELATLRAHWAPERRFAAQSPKLDVTDLRRRWRAAIGRAGGWTREIA
jgi:glycerol kinase